MKIPVCKFPVCIDFCTFMHALDEEKGYLHRDFAGLYAPSHRDHYTGPLEANGERPYLDFWHWLLEHDFAEMHNGSFQYLWSSSLEDPETPEWVRTILKDIFETVKGHPACDKDGINFYVSW